MRKRIDQYADTRSPFARRLDFALRADGISQTEFADRLGTSKQKISDYICGKHNPSFEMLMRIQKELDISLDWLLGLVD